MSNVASGVSLINRDNGAHPTTGVPRLSDTLRRILVQDNVIEINRGEMGGDGYGVFLSSGLPPEHPEIDGYTHDVRIAYNTIIMKDGDGKAFVAMGDHPYFANGSVEIAYNIASAGEYGLFGTKSTDADYENVGATAFAAYCGASSRIHGNVLIGLEASRQASLSSEDAFLGSVEEAGFVAPSWSEAPRVPRADYRLLSSSPFAHAGADLGELSPRCMSILSWPSDPPTPGWEALACGAGTAYDFTSHACETDRAAACGAATTQALTCTDDTMHPLGLRRQRHPRCPRTTSRRL